CLARRGHASEADVKKDGFVRSLQNDVPFKRADLIYVFFCDQSRASLPLNEIQDKFARVGGLVGKINARHQTAQQSAHKYGNCNVRSLRISVRSRNGTGFNRGKRKFPALINGNSSEALEARLRKNLLVSIRCSCVVLVAPGGWKVPR